jgi:hypothetical protein
LAQQQHNPDKVFLKEATATDIQGQEEASVQQHLELAQVIQ